MLQLQEPTMTHTSSLVAATMLVALATAAAAAEPNETIDAATVIPAGTLSATDTLTPGDFANPDTLLGARNFLGAIGAMDDNSSPLGDGFASALGGVPTNSGSVEFVVTGVDDLGFSGSHNVSGAYQAYVDVYQGDTLVDQWTEIRRLEPGLVDEFSVSDFNWIGATYDVYLDNVIAAGGDVDFYTFTGLTPGASFTAETFNGAGSDVDTVLGVFEPDGGLVDVNDDIGQGNLLSRLTGVVPAWGTLSFAVTGYGDDQTFLGYHAENGTYRLQLSFATGQAADFNNDSRVDSADLDVWRSALGLTVAGDANDDNVTDGADFLIWQQQVAPPAAAAAVAAVPEPHEAAMLAALAVALAATRGGKR
jgi:hypothetical protein